MKKIIVSSVVILSLSVNFSFAQQEEGILSSFIENKNSAIREIKSFFKSEKITPVKVELENRDAVINPKQEGAASVQSTMITPVLTGSSTVSTTSLTIPTEKTLCENKKSLLSKKEKINTQIKNQIKDKNKLIDKLLEISADNDTSAKEVFDNKILKLESEVGEAIKIQKNILNIIASSTDSVCDLVVSSSSLSLLSESKSKKIILPVKENKDYSNLNKSLRKLEAENEKQLEKINKFIKTDIKNLLVEISDAE